MIKKVNILHLEDSIKDSEIIRSIIDNGEIVYNYFLADNEKEYLEILEKENIDLILSDYNLPDYNGSEALKVSKKKYAHIPFIFVSGAIGEDAAIHSMVNGATDYVFKNRLERLVPAIKRALRENEVERDREDAEEALKENEKKFRSYIEYAPDMVFIFDNTGRIIDSNRSAWHLSGYSKEEMEQLTLHDILAEESYDNGLLMFTKLLSTGKGAAEFWSKKKDGTRCYLTLDAVQISKTQFLGFGKDITQRKQAEQEVVIANKELLFQNQEKEKRAAELVIANKELVYQNREKEKRADELIMANKELAFQNDEKEKRAAELIIANKELAYQNKEKENRAAELIIANKELTFQNREKEKRADEVIMANKELAFQNDEKEKRAAELIIANNELLFQNGEKEKRAAELMKAREKAEESDNLKTAFLNNLSHEIRTPMNQILGFSSFLRDPELSESQRDDYIEIINNQSHQLLHVIADIVEISEITTGQANLKLSPFNLGEMMNELLTSFKPKAAQRNLEFRLNKGVPDANSMIQGDREKLKDIISHLVENAIKFTDTGEIDIEYSTIGNRLIVAVKDTGIGIDEHEKQLIFDQFRQVEITTTRKYGGLGLGLSISNAYIRMMSGVIRVESWPGRGSTFIVDLPFIPAKQEPETFTEVKLPAISCRPDWKNKTLLIAEDEESNVQYLTAVLKSTGIHLLTAVNGLEAVEQCKVHPEIAVVLMDIKMPRMNGLEATRIIKSFRSDLPVIAITAFAMTRDKEHFLGAGCDDYLPKPLRRDDLIAIIQKHLGSLN